MPNHPLCPPHDLPPTPCENFFYCEHPLELAPELFDALFPQEQQIDFIRGVYERLLRLAAAHPVPTPISHATPQTAGVLERADV